MALAVGGAWSRGQAPGSVAPEGQAEPETRTAPAPAPKERSSADLVKGDSSFLGKDLPFLDPSSEVVAWDGKVWKVSDNRVFRARFEKFLNAPEQASDEEREYQGLIGRVMDLLAPDTVSPLKLDEAWGVLPRAAQFKVDAGLCDSLANAVHTVWLAKRESGRIQKARETLEKEKSTLEWNSQMKARSSFMGDNPPKDPLAAAQWAKERETERDMAMQPFVTRLAEVQAMIKANMLKKEASELQAKIEFQALVGQFFVQRRFQHVLMASRFYRALFSDGDTRLKVGTDAEKLFTETSGLPPTLGVLDSLAREAMRDIEEGVAAFKFLMDKGEMAGAADRLAETFAIGEFMPQMRSLPRDAKREVLRFVQASNQLVSALEVKDYGLAEEKVAALKAMASDFDAAKPTAAIETARTVSAMHLAKARVAAVSGDRDTLEKEMRAATEIWPRNPDLAKVSGAIFSQADIQQQALADMDRLIEQRNFRRIFEDKVRFIAATALYPDRQERLRRVLDDMQIIEGAIIRAKETAKRDDFAGAWESLENVAQQFPDDTLLNQLRAEYTTQAADFVRTVRQAQALEGKGQVGSSLAWYLKAQKLYPFSEFAKAGIDRLVKRILPEEG